MKQNTTRIEAGAGVVDLAPEDAGDLLPVIALRNMVVFPSQVVPLSVGRDISLKSIEAASEQGRRLAIIAQRDASVAEPGPDDLYAWGCSAEILKVLRLPDGARTVIVQGHARIRVLEFTRVEPYLEARVEKAAETPVQGVRTEALVQTLQTLYQQLAELAPYLSGEHVVMAHNTESPGRLADLIVSTLQLELAEKQALLETSDVEERLERVHETLRRELDVQELSSKIQLEVEGNISQSQREYYLREQLRAIKRELGEDEEDDELEGLRRRVSEAGLPEEARQAADAEIKRLARINPASPEYGVSRTYLDWLLELPWGEHTDDRLDLDAAQAVLDRDHYDLEKVKKRILEYLAVRKLKRDMRGPIVCFVGPPGVGKTSLGRSIAEALGREFVRLSLGGIRDEAEIRGHRRTYIGALPGRIIQGMKKAATSNPVFMLDEIDKLVSDFRGDPAAALLEVLDPEQNSTFSDHYLEVPYDLSKVMFIATANWADPIPPALRDRMEIIEIPGYSSADKLQIAERHLVPKQLEAHGLDAGQVTLQKAALETVIEQYTREAGVRSLDRKIAAVARGIAREVVEGLTDRVVVRAEDVRTYLGPQRFYGETADRTRYPGVATGLAWTPFGGEILFIEATSMPGRGRLNLTGQLGDVMKESAQAALSYIRAEAESLGLEPSFLDERDIHVHVPAGAVPKDGPSAGVAITTALVSLLTGRPVKSRIAMTGEMTLRGLVLPVGGIKEKVLAARRAGIKTVILPEKNRASLEDIPEGAREGLRFVFAKEIGQVLQHAISKRRAPKKKVPLLA